MITQQWAMTTWANKASATYVNVDKPINNRYIDAFGRLRPDILRDASLPRRPVKMEEGESVSYVMYDSDDNGNVPVIKITEA